MMNISNDQWKSGQQATERRVQHDHDADRGHCGVLVGGDAAHGHHCATHHLLKVGETQNLKIRSVSEIYFPASRTFLIMTSRKGLCSSSTSVFTSPIL